MNKKSLAIVLTGVWLALSFGEIVTAGPSAATLPTATLSDPKSAAAYLDVLSKQWSLQIVSPSLESCRTHNAALEKAQSELDRPCAQLKTSFKRLDQLLGIDSTQSEFGPSSPLYCVAQIARCGSCKGDEAIGFLGKTLSCGKAAGIEEDEVSGSNLSAALQALAGNASAPATTDAERKIRAQFEADKEEILSCLPEAGDELEDQKKDLKDARERFDELEERLQKKQDALHKLQQDQVDAQNSASDRSDEMNSKVKSVLEEIQNLKDKQDDDVNSTVVRAQQDIDTLGADIKRLMRSRDEAYTTYADKVSELDSQCHASALAQVQSYQKEVYDLMGKSEFSGGDFNGVLSRVGSSMRTKFQELALKNYNACRADKSYKMAVQSRTRARDLAVSKTNDEIQNLLKRQNDIIGQVNQMKTTGQSKGLAALQRKISSLGEQANQQFTKVNRDSQAAAQKYSREMMALSASLSSLGQKVAVARLTNDNDAQLLRLRRLGGKKGGFKEAQASYNALRAAASRMVASCCHYKPGEGVTGDKSTSEKAEADTHCKMACDPYKVGSAGMLFCNKSGDQYEFRDPLHSDRSAK